MENTMGYRFNDSVQDLQALVVHQNINKGQRTGLNSMMELFFGESLDKSAQGSGQDWNKPPTFFRTDPRGKRMLSYLAKDCLSVLAISGAFLFYFDNKLEECALREKVEENCFPDLVSSFS
jgi:hypothetical protein